MTRQRRFLTRAAALFILIGPLALPSGCGKSPTEPEWEPLGPATSVRVLASATSTTDLDGTEVLLLADGLPIADITLSAPTSNPAIVTFDSLEQSSITHPITYRVVVRKRGFTVQSRDLALTGTIVPELAFTLQKLEDGEMIRVVGAVVSDPGTLTSIIVSQPPAVQDYVDGVPPAVLMLSGVSGSVVVAALTGLDVPAVTASGGVVTKSVVSAMHVSAATPAPSAAMTVTLPVPVDSVHRVHVTGGVLDVVRYNFGSHTWQLAGEATIGAGGTVSTSLTGLGEEEIIALATTPTVSVTTSDLGSETIEADLVDDLKGQGARDMTYPLDPTISCTIQQVARPPHTDWHSERPAVIPPPSGLSPAHWALVAPHIASRLPELAAWLYSDDTWPQVALLAERAEILLIRKRADLTFEFRFGELVVAPSIRVDYTAAEVSPVAEAT